MYMGWYKKLDNPGPIYMGVYRKPDNPSYIYMDVYKKPDNLVLCICAGTKSWTIQPYVHELVQKTRHLAMAQALCTCLAQKTGRVPYRMRL
jgi:hypothetical protein